MATTIEDIQYDEMINQLHYEAVMKNASLEQCIYIFVEGESEESTFQTLLEHSGLSFEQNGIVIANYGGIGNLKHSIRLLKKTLSHDRPVIVTYDDDLEGKKATKHLNDPLTTPFKIPQTPVVKYYDGSIGGSFEEAFTPECFINACFHTDVLPPVFSALSKDFEIGFDLTKPWMPQLHQFIQCKGLKSKSFNKVKLAEKMAETCEPIPNTFKTLARVALELRKNNPVKHPDDIDIRI